MVLNKISGLISFIDKTLRGSSKQEETKNSSSNDDRITIEQEFELKISDDKLVHILEQKLAQELFKKEDKDYRLIRYTIDLIEVIVEEED